MTDSTEQLIEKLNERLEAVHGHIMMIHFAVNSNYERTAQQPESIKEFLKKLARNADIFREIPGALAIFKQKHDQTIRKCFTAIDNVRHILLSAETLAKRDPEQANKNLQYLAERLRYWRNILNSETKSTRNELPGIQEAFSHCANMINKQLALGEAAMHNMFDMVPTRTPGEFNYQTLPGVNNDTNMELSSWLSERLSTHQRYLQQNRQKLEAFESYSQVVPLVEQLNLKLGRLKSSAFKILPFTMRQPFYLAAFQDFFEIRHKCRQLSKSQNAIEALQKSHVTAHELLTSEYYAECQNIKKLMHSDIAVTREKQGVRERFDLFSRGLNALFNQEFATRKPEFEDSFEQFKKAVREEKSRTRRQEVQDRQKVRQAVKAGRAEEIVHEYQTAAAASASDTKAALDFTPSNLSSASISTLELLRGIVNNSAGTTFIKYEDVAKMLFDIGATSRPCSGGSSHQHFVLVGIDPADYSEHNLPISLVIPHGSRLSRVGDCLNFSDYKNCYSQLERLGMYRWLDAQCSQESCFKFKK